MKEKLHFLFRKELLPIYIILLLSVLLIIFFSCFLTEKKKLNDAYAEFEVEKQALIEDGQLYYTDPTISETVRNFLITAFKKDESFQKMRENIRPYTSSESVLYMFFPDNSYDESIIPEVTLSDFTDVTVQYDNVSARCHMKASKNVLDHGAAFAYTLECTAELSKTDNGWLITDVTSLIQY